MKSRTSHAKKKGTIPGSPVRPSAITGLGQVALHLNALASPKAYDSAQRAAWEDAERVLGAVVHDPRARPGTTIATQPFPPSLAWALDSFNRLARRFPVPLMVHGRKWQDGEPVDTRRFLRLVKPEQGMVWLLWRYVFSERGWKRLKRCRQCSAWFEDRTKNRSQEFCDADCLNRYWDRAKRQNARAAALKKKGKARLILERLKRLEARSKASKPAKKGKHAAT